MKKTMLKLCLTLLLGITIFYSCKKDPSPGNTTFHDGLNFLKLDWTPTEQEFFSLTHRDLGVNSRSVTKAKYHPIITEAYNQIAEENTREHFVDNLARRAGFPMWLSASIHVDAQTQETLVVVPLSKPSDHKISSFISLYKKKGDLNEKFVISGISRNRILDTLPGSNVYNKALFASLMLKKEQQLFKQIDPILQEAYCRNKSEIINYGGGGASGPGGSNTLLPPIQLNCEWRYIQICHDNTGSEWIKGGVVPIHLDHDQDGIPNEEDPDWQQLASQGLTQEEFTQYVEQYWHYEFEEEYGNYEDYWDANGFEWNGGADLADFFEKIGDMLQDIGDWIDDHVGNFDIGDWWHDIFDDGPPCPGWNANGEAVDREIQCNWFYAYICDEDGQAWWNDIVDLIPYSANDASFQGSEQARFCAHWEENYSDIFPTCDDLNYEAGAWGAYGDCDIYSPLYESCLDEHFMESYVNSPPPNTVHLNDPKKLIDDCFYSDSECPNCKFSVTIYIEQPVPGERDVYGGDGGSKSGGHTFLSIQQVDFSSAGFDDKIITVGWYPVNKPSGTEEVKGYLYPENESTLYNISVTYQLSRLQLQSIQNFMYNIGDFHNVNTANCSTMAVAALNSAGIVLPKTPRSLLLLGTIDVNPGDLGEDLRNNHAGASSFYSSPTYINLSELDLSTCNE